MRVSMKGPPGLKDKRPAKSPAYLAKVRSLPCCICEWLHATQQSPTQAHHVIHDRYGTRKTPDRDAIPLCEGHHQGDFDTSKIAIHRDPKRWRELFGPDHQWSEQTRARLTVSV